MLKRIVIFWLIVMQPVLAEELVVLDEELQTLLTLDLEDLTTVSIASKRSEAIDDAPGIITVITAAEIQRYGYRNLRDILDRQTHMQIVGSNVFPHDRVSLRGSTFTHTDNTVLPLLNGRPIRDGTAISNNMDLYNFFPVESIKQIEIVRGPGSVLYGTNAFAGAINIITKEAPSTPTGDLSISYGSFDSKKISLNGGGKWGDLEVLGSINASDSNGDNFNNITDQFGTRGTYKTGGNGVSAVINAKYKGFTLNALATNISQEQVRTAFQFPSDDLDTDRQYIDLGYQHNITDNWDVSANILYHKYDIDFVLNNANAITGNTSENIFGEVTTRANISENLTVLAGGSYNEISGLFKINRFTYNSSTISAYVQADFWLLNWLKIIGGVQFNKPKQLTADISPRIGSIIKFNNNWSGKILYGEAFREPSPVDRFVNVPGIVVGTRTLEPETIETLDAQLNYSGERGSLSATYFHSFQKLISRVGASPQVISNAGEVTYDGFELEGKLFLGKNLSFIGNLSYQTNDKDDGTENVTYAPDWMFKSGISYDSNRGYTFSVFNSYFAASTLQNQDFNPTVANVNPDADSYNLLTANLNMNLGKILNDQDYSHINFSLYGDNLLDEDIFFPSISATSVNSIPHHQGRGFYGTISIGF